MSEGVLQDHHRRRNTGPVFSWICCRKFLIWSYLLLQVSMLLCCQCVTHFSYKTICITLLFVHVIYGLVSFFGDLFLILLFFFYNC